MHTIPQKTLSIFLLINERILLKLIPPVVHATAFELPFVNAMLQWSQYPCNTKHSHRLRNSKQNKLIQRSIDAKSCNKIYVLVWTARRVPRHKGHLRLGQDLNHSFVNLKFKICWLDKYVNNLPWATITMQLELLNNRQWYR